MDQNRERAVYALSLIVFTVVVSLLALAASLMWNLAYVVLITTAIGAHVVLVGVISNKRQRIACLVASWTMALSILALWVVAGL